MAKAYFRSVDEYIATHPEKVQVILQNVRRIIRKALPDAEEVISYQIPAFKLTDGPVLWFAGWKQHYSLYPASRSFVETFKKELSSYKIDKGTIRFPLSEQVPEKLIDRFARFRAREITKRAKVEYHGVKKK